MRNLKPRLTSLEWGGAATPRDMNFLREERGWLGRSVLCVCVCVSVTLANQKIQHFLENQLCFSPDLAANASVAENPVLFEKMC